MKVTPVILLALVPLLLLLLLQVESGSAAKGGNNKENNYQSKSGAAEAAGKGRSSAKSGNASGKAKSSAAKASAGKAAAEKKDFNYEAASKSGSSSAIKKLHAHKMKSAAEAAKAKQSAMSAAKAAGQQQQKSSSAKSAEAAAAAQKAAAKKANSQQLQQQQLEAGHYSAKANAAHQHQQHLNAEAHSAAEAKAAAAAAAAAKSAEMSKASHHHHQHQEQAKLAAAAAATSEAKHGSEAAPCPNCKAGSAHQHQQQQKSVPSSQLAVSKSSAAESSAAAAATTAAESAKKAHHQQKSASSSSSVKRTNYHHQQKPNHHHNLYQNNEQYGYLTNTYQQQQQHSKPAYNAHNSYGQNNDYGGYQQQDTLIQANVISRLGDRTPFWLPRNDYYKEKDFPEGLNQLINVGKERLVNYGRVLRQRYLNLINNLRLKDITTQSANDRVSIESGTALLAGLLPPVGSKNQVWSSADELARLWQPNAVSSVELCRDWLLNTDAPCRTAQLVENVTIIEEAPELKHFLAANREVIRRLEVLTGEDFTSGRALSWVWIANVYDTYISEAEYFGAAFYPPRWADEQTLAVLRQANHLKFSVWGHDQAYLRLRGGPLLQEITDNLIKAAKDPEATGRSLAIYSTFDSNIAVVEHLLGIFRGGQAGYGSGLLIELHRDNYSTNSYNNKGGEPVVAVFSVDVPSGVKISQIDLSRSERFRKHCGGYKHSGPSCPLSSFAVALQNHLLTLEEAEVKCNNDH